MELDLEGLRSTYVERIALQASHGLTSQQAHRLVRKRHQRFVSVGEGWEAMKKRRREARKKRRERTKGAR